MTEYLRTVENSGEKDSVDQETGWESVVKMEFVEKETAKPTAEQEESAEQKTEHLAVLREKIAGPKPVEELSEKDAAQEYMDLLLDLSSNFTSVEGKLSRVARIDEDGKAIVSNRGYSGDTDLVKNLAKRAEYELDESDNFRDEGVSLQDFHYNDKYLDRALAMRMADTLLMNEQKWRQAGDAFEAAGAKLANAEDALARFDKEDGKKNIFQKMLKFGSRRKERQKLEANIERARGWQAQVKYNSTAANHELLEGLNRAYSEDYGYAHHKLDRAHDKDQEYKEQANEEYNRKFFGQDDPERQAKIERALALRAKLHPKNNREW